MDSCCRVNILCSGRGGAACPGLKQPYPAASVPTPVCVGSSLPFVHVLPDLLRSDSFQGDSGKCDSRVSPSAVCQCGGGEHPGKGDFCGLPSAALQPWIWGEGAICCHLARWLQGHRAHHCLQPWQEELAVCLLGCCLWQGMGAGGTWW